MNAQEGMENKQVTMEIKGEEVEVLGEGEGEGEEEGSIHRDCQEER